MYQVSSVDVSLFDNLVNVVIESSEEMVSFEWIISFDIESLEVVEIEVVERYADDGSDYRFYRIGREGMAVAKEAAKNAVVVVSQ